MEIDFSNKIILIDSIKTEKDLNDLPLHPRHYNSYLKKIHLMLVLNVFGYSTILLPQDVNVEEAEGKKYYIGEGYKSKEEYLLPKLDFPKFSSKKSYYNYLEELSKKLENFNIEREIGYTRQDILSKTFGIIDQISNVAMLDALNEQTEMSNFPQTLLTTFNVFSIIGLMFNLRNATAQMDVVEIDEEIRSNNRDLIDFLGSVIDIAFKFLGDEFDGLIGEDCKFQKSMDDIIKNVLNYYASNLDVNRFLSNESFVISPTVVISLWLAALNPRPIEYKYSFKNGELKAYGIKLNLEFIGRLLKYTGTIDYNTEYEFNNNKIEPELMVGIVDIIRDYFVLTNTELNPSYGLIIESSNYKTSYICFGRKEETTSFINTLIEIDKITLSKILEDQHINYTFKLYSIFDYDLIELDSILLLYLSGLINGKADQMLKEGEQND